MEIWLERPHYSELSGNYLGEEPLTVMFDHLLEKGNLNYKHLKFEKSNILLVTFEEHTNKGGPKEHPNYRIKIEEYKNSL